MEVSTPPNDEPLVARARDGDYEAFDALVALHEQPLYRLAMGIVRQREDAEDIVQTAFLSAMEHLAEFRGEASFRTWMRRIVTNRALNVLRKRRGLKIAPNDCPDGDDDCLPKPEYIADWRDGVEQTIERREMRALLDRALAQISDNLRIVFVLRDMEGLTTKETAEAVGITEANVKVRLLRARLALREILTAALGDPERAVDPDAAIHQADVEVTEP